MTAGVDGTATSLRPGFYPAPPMRFTAIGYDPVSGALNSQKVKYAVMAGSPAVEFDASRRSATEVYMIHSWDLSDFAQLSLGLVVPWPDAPFLVRCRRAMPGNPDLLTVRITARPMEERPADPFATDSLATEQYWQTYSRYLLVTIEYATEDMLDPGDTVNAQVVIKDHPATFTVQKKTIGGEFINLPAKNTRWLTTEKKAHGPPDVRPQGAGFNFINISGGSTLLDYVNLSTDDLIALSDPRKVIWVPQNSRVKADGIHVEVGAVDSPDNAIAANLYPKVIALTEWTICWRHVFSVPWQSINRMLGKVNGNRMPLFAEAPEETVLFTGGTVSKEPLRTWDGRNLFTIEYHFIEKKLWDLHKAENYFAVLGWNHFWRSDATTQGGQFQRLVVDKATLDGPYQQADFRRLFEADDYFSFEDGIDAFEPHPANGVPSQQAKTARDGTERGSRAAYPMP